MHVSEGYFRRERARRGGKKSAKHYPRVESKEEKKIILTLNFSPTLLMSKLDQRGLFLKRHLKNLMRKRN